MAIITLSTPAGSYKTKIDTEAMEIKIVEAFLGVRFETEDGEVLHVSMRDSGFELVYGDRSEGILFPRTQRVELKKGRIDIS